MSLVLDVDGDRWRAHLRGVAEARPGLVPVIKGNGYGFGLARLARKSAWLGVDSVAVGTPGEVAEVASRFDGDVVVLTPWRSFEAPLLEGVAADRVIHTVGRTEDLAALAGHHDHPRVVLELITSMKRHGFSARDLRDAVAQARAGGVRIEGASIHLPLGRGGANLAEAEALMTDLVAAGLLETAHGTPTLWVSHLGAGDAATLAARYPELRIRQRIGTELWLGDRSALHVTAHVLDSHPVRRGEVFGYRGRTAPRNGTILVVSGGTAHGIGLESPTGETSARARVGSLARGGLDAVGLARSPYTVDGKGRYFAEPPHMQSSMLFLPSGTSIPAVGDQVQVRVRFTATTFDAVDLS
ncbi:MAG: alanine racemase [Marmoricola sp.]